MNRQLLQKKFIETANGKIFYWMNNSFPDRPLAILLHGLSSNHTTWEKAMEILAENEYNSLAIDLRGHGYSDKTKKKNLYKLAVLTDDLQAIIEKEQIQNFILVGYSFGGQIAIDYAAKHQENIKGLMLISANYAPPLASLRLGGLTFLARIILNLLAALLIWQKRQTYHYYQHGQATGYWNSVWDGLRTMPLAVNFWLLSEVTGIDLTEAIKKLHVPLIILCGQKDIFIAPKKTKQITEQIPGAQFIISKNPDHFVGTNSQDEIIQLILNFLKNK